MGSVEEYDEMKTNLMNLDDAFFYEKLPRADKTNLEIENYEKKYSRRNI